MIPIKERLESDVLIVGGGIAGLMAAIAAADKGASVTLLDKANTKRSGAGATGNDHFLCYIPEKHGTIDVVYEEFMDSQNATSNDTPLVMRFLETSPTIVNMWNDWGINMKPTGDFHFEGHAYPGRPKIFLKYDGHNQKKVLTEQAKKRGVRIVNHSPVLELLRDDHRRPGPRYFLRRAGLSHREGQSRSGRHGIRQPSVHDRSHAEPDVQHEHVPFRNR